MRIKKTVSKQWDSLKRIVCKNFQIKLTMHISICTMDHETLALKPLNNEYFFVFDMYLKHRP